MSKFLLMLFVALTTTVCCADPDVAVMAVMRDADLKWIENPLVPGLSQAVLFGNPSQPGLYVIRVRFAPGVMSPPHFHPEERYVSVLKGTWWVGAESTWNRSLTTPMAAGSFVVHHPHKIHFDGAKDEEAIVQIVGMGPSGTSLVDAAGHAK